MIKWAIAIIILIGGIQTVSAGIKIYPEAEILEGKIVFAYYDRSDSTMSLLVLKDGALSKLTNMQGEILSPKYSPSGDVIGFYADNGYTFEEKRKNWGIYLIHEDGGNLQRILEDNQMLFGFFDENHLVYRDYSEEKKQREYWLVDITEKKLRQLTNDEVEKNYQSNRLPKSHQRDHSHTIYSPDGKKKVWYKEVRKDIFSDLWMTDLTTGSETLLLEDKGGSYYRDPVWSSDSKKIMLLRDYYFLDYFFGKYEIILYDIETKGKIRILKAPANSIKGFDWWTPPVK